MLNAWMFVRKCSRLHRVAVWSAQVALFATAGVMAFALRFDLNVPRQHMSSLAIALAVWIVVKAITFRAMGLDRGWWRYVSMSDLMRIGMANVAGSAASAVAIVLLVPAGFPRSIYLIDFMICLLATAGARAAVRMVVEAVAQGKPDQSEKRTLIYGAGESGIALLREIQKNTKLPYCVVGFVDDQAEKRGVRIMGTPVLGRGEELGLLIKRRSIATVLVAIPSANGTEMSRILELCHAAGVECKTVPGLGELIESSGVAGQIRDVAVEDLLGRKPVRLDEVALRERLAGKVVMVTGAAGSIGSEMCRQIARYQPAGIVGFEIAETPLFEIDREMKEKFPNVAFYPEIGSIQKRGRLDEVMALYRPSAVYHAAAYKHVPMMEQHCFEAIENNVFGTYNVASAAAEHGVDDFVMISTDKAVRPTNVMGASKRLAELTILALQNGGTKFVAVRFGNVLGSNGSVIPIFKKQIAAGGPVTVTHPEMRRFFMTIPEASQLVLQAALVGEGGQICVLDMGEPVRIMDLARNLILLSGLRPDVDVPIRFTGMRPGEKLYEELHDILEDTAPTVHEKIRVYVGSGLPEGEMLEWLDTLREICRERNMGRLVVALKEMVLDYSPSAPLLKRVIGRQERRQPAAAAG